MCTYIHRLKSTLSVYMRAPCDTRFAYTYAEQAHTVCLLPAVCMHRTLLPPHHPGLDVQPSLAPYGRVGKAHQFMGLSKHCGQGYSVRLYLHVGVATQPRTHAHIEAVLGKLTKTVRASRGFVCKAAPLRACIAPEWLRLRSMVYTAADTGNH